MTIAQAPYRYDSRPTPRSQTVDALLAGLCVLMLLIYSQGWVTPIFGDLATDSTSAILRDAFFPAYGIAIAIIGVTLKDALRATIRQPALLVILMIVSLSVFWSVARDQTARRAIAIAFTTMSGVALGARYRWSSRWRRYWPSVTPSSPCLRY